MNEISISIEQLDNMKHAIGYERSEVKRGKYEAYRNYFTTNGPEESWEKLCDKGYAVSGAGAKYVVYHVSDKGLELMENLLDIKIIIDSY